MPAAIALAAAIAAPASAQIYGMGTGKQGFFTYSARRGHRQSRRRSRPEPAPAAVWRHQRLCAGRQCRRDRVRPRQRIGDALRRHRQGDLQGQAAARPARGRDAHPALIPNSSCARIRRSRPSPTSRASACRAISSASACIDVLTKGMLANANLSYADVQKVPVPNVVGGADEFAQGKADVFMFALGSGKVSEVDAQVGGLRVLPIDPSPEAMARMRKFIPVAYAEQARTRQRPPRHRRADLGLCLRLSGAGQRQGGRRRRSTSSPRSCTTTRRRLAAVFGALSGFDPKRMVKDMGPAQFHPGAIKYYKEIGEWPPKSRQLNEDAPAQDSAVSDETHQRAGGAHVNGHPPADRCRRQPAHARLDRLCDRSSIAMCWACCLFNEQFLAGMLGLGLALVYLTQPARRRAARPRCPGTTGCWRRRASSSASYRAVRFPALSEDMTDAAARRADRRLHHRAAGDRGAAPHRRPGADHRRAGVSRLRAGRPSGARRARRPAGQAHAARLLSGLGLRQHARPAADGGDDHRHRLRVSSARCCSPPAARPSSPTSRSP